VHAHPLLLYLPSRTQLWCMFQLRGQIHTPYFYSALYVLCELAYWGIGEWGVRWVRCEGGIGGRQGGCAKVEEALRGWGPKGEG